MYQVLCWNKQIGLTELINVCEGLQKLTVHSAKCKPKKYFVLVNSNNHEENDKLKNISSRRNKLHNCHKTFVATSSVYNDAVTFSCLS